MGNQVGINRFRGKGRERHQAGPRGSSAVTCSQAQTSAERKGVARARNGKQNKTQGNDSDALKGSCNTKWAVKSSSVLNK